MTSEKSVPTTVNMTVEFEENIPPIIFGDDKEHSIQRVIECISPLQVAIVFHKGGVRVEVVNSETRLILLLDDGRKVLATLDVSANEWKEVSYLQDPPSGFAQKIVQSRQH